VGRGSGEECPFVLRIKSGRISNVAYFARLPASSRVLLVNSSAQGSTRSPEDRSLGQPRCLSGRRAAGAASASERHGAVRGIRGEFSHRQRLVGRRQQPARNNRLLGRCRLQFWRRGYSQRLPEGILCRRWGLWRPLEPALPELHGGLHESQHRPQRLLQCEPELLVQDTGY